MTIIHTINSLYFDNIWRLYASLVASVGRLFIFLTLAQTVIKQNKVVDKRGGVLTAHLLTHTQQIKPWHKSIEIYEKDLQ